VSRWQYSRQNLSFKRADFVLELAKVFNVSLGFAAIRFRELCGQSPGVALLSVLRKEHLRVYQQSLGHLKPRSVTIEQAEELGLAFELLPTYSAEGYALPNVGRKLRAERSTAVWVTQPRASLGFDQSPDHLEGLLWQLGPRGCRSPFRRVCTKHGFPPRSCCIVLQSRFLPGHAAREVYKSHGSHSTARGGQLRAQ